MRLIDADALIEQFRPYLHLDERIDPDVVIDFIRNAPAIAPPPNPPLTLEELREMDGEPVWVEWIKSRRGEWGIAEAKRQICRLTWSSSKICVSFNRYGKTWLAYRRKPEEGTPCS